jgi:hypothetical protein
MESTFPVSLARAGAQLFLDEDADRKRRSAKKREAQTGNAGTQPAPSQEAVAKESAKPKKTKTGSQGAADQAAEIQELFERVLVVVAAATILVKVIAVILPYLTPGLLHVHWPWM